jgi:hypothetical protein
MQNSARRKSKRYSSARLTGGAICLPLKGISTRPFIFLDLRDTRPVPSQHSLPNPYVPFLDRNVSATMSTRGYPRPNPHIRRSNPVAAASIFMAVIAIALVLVLLFW